MQRGQPRIAAVLHLHSADRVLPTYPANLSKAAERSLIDLGVQTRTGVMVIAIDDRGVTIKSGNIVTQNNSELMQIFQVEPIYVTFAVPEARLADVKRYMGNGTLPVTAKPQDGSGESETGARREGKRA